jgi:hypothetical protein
VTPFRQVFVVGSQCDSMNELDSLEAVAGDLYSVLAGSEHDDAADVGTLLQGRVSSGEIISTFRQAVRQAAKNNATLVTAFLGHGFLPGTGTDSTLYFMGADTVVSSRATGVNLGEILLEAADEPGVAGVLAIIDTCHAAGGTPSFARLNGGVNQGRARIAVICGCTAQQESYGLQLSREIIDIAQHGIAAPDAGPLLQVNGPLLATLQQRLLQQDVTPILFGDPEALWVAKNPAHGVVVSSDVGPGITALREAISAWMPDSSIPSSLSDVALNEWTDRAERAPASPWRSRVIDVLCSIVTARRTHRFLTSSGVQLTSSAVARALAALEVPITGSHIGLTRNQEHALQHVALTYSPALDADCRSRVVQFTLVVLQEAGYPLDGDLLTGWASAIGAPVAVNDEIERQRASQREHRLRLILVLNTTVTGTWPESVDCWLLDGEQVLDRCTLSTTRDERGCDESVMAAVDWAEEHAATLDLPLRRVEVAVPTALLLGWRPESVGEVFLGVDYDVLTHWSERLRGARTGDLSRIQRRLSRATQRRGGGPEQPGGPVLWLSEAELADREGLRHRIRRGQLARAVGLMVCPDSDILTLLLAQTAIVLWPHECTLTVDHVLAVEGFWPCLPEKLCHAYRLSWEDDAPRPLGQLRAVWDDEDWLVFCKKLLARQGND